MSLNVIRCTSSDFKDLTPEVGQVVCIKDNDEDPGRLMMWSGTEWNDIKADANSEIQMTAYDINKQVIHQLPTLTEDELIEKKEMIYQYCEETANEYYMLLCRDLNYFTLCNRHPKLISKEHNVRVYVDNDELITIQDLIIECAQVHGDIKAIDRVDGAIEIWVDNPNFDNSTYVMYFFPYDGGVEACR